jgi:hypothetical protein
MNMAGASSGCQQRAFQISHIKLGLEMNTGELLRSIYSTKYSSGDWKNLEGRRVVIAGAQWGEGEEPLTVNTESSAGDLTFQRKKQITMTMEHEQWRLYK